MNVICKNRGEGKTTELIKLSAAKNLVIITPTVRMADYIYEMAKDVTKLSFKRYHNKNMLSKKS